MLAHNHSLLRRFDCQTELSSLAVDHVIMKDILVGTYGKTFHTWRYDQQNSSIPLGIPELVMGYTGDDQITPDFVTQRDELFGVNTSAVRESRKDITCGLLTWLPTIT